MEIDKRCYTASMAEILVSQTYFNTAISVYEHLIEKDPSNEAYKKRLLNILKMKEYLKDEPSREIVELFKEWFDLAVKSKRLLWIKRSKKIYAAEK